MRCKACNKILIGSVEAVDNNNTHQLDEMCTNCISMAYDGGIEYKENNKWNSEPTIGEVKKFHNEAELERSYIGGSWTGLTSTEDIITKISIDGTIKIEH